MPTSQGACWQGAHPLAAGSEDVANTKVGAVVGGASRWAWPAATPPKGPASSAQRAANTPQRCHSPCRPYPIIHRQGMYQHRVGVLGSACTVGACAWGLWGSLDLCSPGSGSGSDSGLWPCLPSARGLDAVPSEAMPPARPCGAPAVSTVAPAPCCTGSGCAGSLRWCRCCASWLAPN